MPTKHKLLVVNEFHPETIAKLDSLYDTIHFWEVEEADKQAMLASLHGSCEAAASASWVCDERIYKLDSLQIIACFGVGVDAINFQETARQNIKVTNTPDVLNDAVADIALALILATSRNLVNADRFIRDGNWLKGPFPFGQSLAEKTLGIIGLGRIGEEIVHRSLPFKLKIAYHNRSPKKLPYTYYPSINELAENSDFLLCMLPGGSETAKIINAEVFRSLGANGVFINVGRGSSVDEKALIAALNTGQIAGAGLDVYSNEPEVAKELIDSRKVVLLPHIGSATIQTRRAMGNLVINNLDAWFKKQPLLTEVVHR